MTAPRQNSPLIVPLGETSIFSAEGTFGSPGIVIMSPVSATVKPAPAETLTLRTVTLNPSGAPSFAGSSEKEYWVFAMQTGSLPKPRDSSSAICFSACGEDDAVAAVYAGHDRLYLLRYA